MMNQINQMQKSVLLLLITNATRKHIVILLNTGCATSVNSMIDAVINCFRTVIVILRRSKIKLLNTTR